MNVSRPSIPTFQRVDATKSLQCVPAVHPSGATQYDETMKRNEPPNYEETPAELKCTLLSRRQNETAVIPFTLGKAGKRSEGTNDLEDGSQGRVNG